MELPDSFFRQQKPLEPEVPPEADGMTPQEFMHGVGLYVVEAGRLMSQKFKVPNPSSLPHYAELSEMMPNTRRGFAETNSHGARFLWRQSVPYGRQKSRVDDMFLYQRLAAYYREGKKADTALAFLHFIDPGDSKGPGVHTDAILHAGAFLTDAPDQLVWFKHNEGVDVLDDPVAIGKLFDTFVEVEMLELAETHVKETAVPFSQRNMVQPLARTAGTLAALSRIARGKPIN